MSIGLLLWHAQTSFANASNATEQYERAPKSDHFPSCSWYTCDVVADISDPLAPAVLFNHRTPVYIFPPSTAELFRLLALVQLWNALIGGDVGGVAGDLPRATEVLYLAYSHACSDIYNADDSVLL